MSKRSVSLLNNKDLGNIGKFIEYIFFKLTTKKSSLQNQITVSKMTYLTKERMKNANVFKNNDVLKVKDLILEFG